ncbi:hypothetical protein IGB42_02472 [Andreprevotia sp. IGB-42]|uniref:DUF3833 domain-containing protein n=1 Tax=Andreprevotia sp. IGB-42 TaxID=2497473 RepID=UPI001359ADE3|nr:DUF3833 domain-containing protein [Andreprevotia sp. IGB-42]KAF0813072.1 hypothetical protein IGB42_02472 [Andreprevotia sp. IGB-42]
MKRGLIVLCCSALLACASPDVALYRDQKPVLDPVHYFSGKTEAWGMFQKRGGEVVKRFHVEIAGRVEGKALILDEHFSYSDGTTQQRTWTLLKQADGRWHGTAGDVVGEAIGEVAGNALHWQYTLRLPVDGREYDMHMDDWMYQMDDHTLINRTTMSKLGIEVGQITLFFRKLQ